VIDDGEHPVAAEDFGNGFGVDVGYIGAGYARIMIKYIA